MGTSQKEAHQRRWAPAASLLTRRRLLSIVATAVIGLATSVALGATQTADWLTGGQNLDNSRYQPNESAIRAANVSTLAPKFTFTAGGTSPATPAVDGRRVYFPDSAGNLFAIDRSTGATAWTASIAALSGINVANGAIGNDYAHGLLLRSRARC